MYGGRAVCRLLVLLSLLLRNHVSGRTGTSSPPPLYVKTHRWIAKVHGLDVSTTDEPTITMKTRAHNTRTSPVCYHPRRRKPSRPW